MSLRVQFVDDSGNFLTAEGIHDLGIKLFIKKRLLIVGIQSFYGGSQRGDLVAVHRDVGNSYMPEEGQEL